jgi:ATP-binding cassette subfamily A (ABC1) protein 3
VKLLSGGEKRKLSVALAFIGEPKIIFLDEPTSGLDTQAKRHLWDILKKYKQGRIIILVTHYMDEADFLGDRIAIMGEGNIMTCGTPSFLKSTYGVGYSLNIVRKDSGDAGKIQNFIQN